MGKKPWTSGPKELLCHAVEHLRADTPFDHRIAMISVDNAAELIIKTYLGLPKRARGAAGPSRRRLDEASNSFPDLLDLLEEYAVDALEGLHLDDIEWYHRLRNTLYHEGNGITVEPDKVDAYVQISRVLLQNLLGETIDDPAVAEPHSMLGNFVSSWASLEHVVRSLAERDVPEVDSDRYSFIQLVDGMRSHDVIDADLRSEVAALWASRNAIVHGSAKVDASELKDVIDRLEAIAASFRDYLAHDISDVYDSDEFREARDDYESREYYDPPDCDESDTDA